MTVGPDLNFNGSRDVFVVKISGQPDLVVAAVNFSPSAVKPGGTLAVFDIASNAALGTAKPSTTRYYLSTDTVKSVTDILLGGSRLVPSLLPGDGNIGSATVTVPPNIPAGSYHVLACADDTKSIAELDEANNCIASGGVMQVVLPDLTVSDVSLSPSAVKPGGTFTAKDTNRNVGLDTAKPSTTRYYLSSDTVKSADDILLTGTAASSATMQVTR